MPTTTYEDFKLQQLESTTTKRIYGHLIESSAQSRIPSTSSSKWILVSPCLCVWIYPENPCPCKKSILYWILESDIQKSGKVDRKTDDGEELFYFDVDKKAQVVIEIARSTSITSLPADRKEALMKLAKLALKMKQLKQNSQTGASLGQGSGNKVIYSWRDVWDIIEEVVEGIDATGEFGTFVDTASEVPWWVWFLPLLDWL